jgi:hypothetical protein
MIAALGLVCMLAGPASALAITSDKHALKSGEIVTLNVTGMTNGTSFTMKVTNDQQMSTLPSAFGNSNLTLPNAVDWKNFTVSMTNTTENSVIVDDYHAGEGISHELIFNGTSKDNLFSRNHTLDTFEGGAVSANWIATPAAGATNVTSSFELNGTKIGGSDTFEINTSGYSAHPATITVGIIANGTLAYQDTFTLEQGVLPAVIPTLIPGSSSASGSDSYTGATWTIKPAVNNTTANLTANVTVTTTLSTAGTVKAGEIPAAGLNLAGTTVGANTTGNVTNTTNTTTTQPSGAPFALITLIGLGLACLVFRSRR